MIGQGDQISGVFGKKSNNNTQKQIHNKASLESLFFSESSLPQKYDSIIFSLNFATLIEHHAHVSEQYRKDLIESYKGTAELKQENIYLKQKMKQLTE